MYTAFEKAWANSYYFLSVGLELDENSNLQALFGDGSTFLNEFVIPANYILTGQMSMDIKPIEPKLPMLLQSIKQRFDCGIHILTALVDNNIYIYEDDLESALDKAVRRLNSNYKKVFAMVSGGKPFITYASKRQGIIGTYHLPVVRLCDVKTDTTLNLQAMMKTKPSILNDYCVEALRNGVNGGVIDESQLVVETYPILKNGACYNIRVNALEPALPIYFVKKIINNLPAETSAFETPYHAAYDYAKNNIDDNHLAYQWLSEAIAEYDSFKTAGTEINDDVVKQYLADTYGIHTDDLSQLRVLSDDTVSDYLANAYGIPRGDIQSAILVPTAKRLYTSSYLVPNASEMTAEEFINSVTDNDTAASGTLDEIIDAFCKEELFDEEDTVANLIRYINDEPLKSPMSDISIAQCAIGDCEHIPDAVKDDIIAALDGKCDFVVPDLMSELTSLQLPDDLLTALSVAAQAHKPFTMPETPKAEVTADDVVTFMVQSGVPRVRANNLCNNGFKPSSDDLRDTLIQLGFDDSFVNSTMSGTRPAPTVDDITTFLDDKGIKDKDFIDDLLKGVMPQKGLPDLDDMPYKVAASILYDVRSELSTNDTFEFRASCVPILYGYIRILMVDTKNDDDVSECISYLNKLEEECNEQGKAILRKAVSSLK